MPIPRLDLLSSNTAFADDRGGLLLQSRPTLAFMRQLQEALGDAYADDGAAAALPATGSPMTYTAAERVSLHLAGGTVSALAYRRGTTSMALAYTAGGQLIHLNPGDQVVITYTVAPTLTVVPR